MPTKQKQCDCLTLRALQMFVLLLKSVSTSFRPTYRQSHGTLGVLNEWPSCRSTDSVGLVAATNTLEFTYAIQCIRRRVLTYTKNACAETNCNTLALSVMTLAYCVHLVFGLSMSAITVICWTKTHNNCTVFTYQPRRHAAVPPTTEAFQRYSRHRRMSVITKCTTVMQMQHIKAAKYLSWQNLKMCHV